MMGVEVLNSIGHKFKNAEKESDPSPESIAIGRFLGALERLEKDEVYGFLNYIFENGQHINIDGKTGAQQLLEFFDSSNFTSKLREQGSVDAEGACFQFKNQLESSLHDSPNSFNPNRTAHAEEAINDIQNFLDRTFGDGYDSVPNQVAAGMFLLAYGDQLNVSDCEWIKDTD